MRKIIPLLLLLAFLIPTVIAETGISGDWVLTGYQSSMIYPSGIHIPGYMIEWAVSCWDVKVSTVATVEVWVDWGLGSGLQIAGIVQNNQQSFTVISSPWYPQSVKVDTVFNGVIKCVSASTAGYFTFTVTIMAPTVTGSSGSQAPTHV